VLPGREDDVVCSKIMPVRSRNQSEGVRERSGRSVNLMPWSWGGGVRGQGRDPLVFRLGLFGADADSLSGGRSLGQQGGAALAGAGEC